MRTGNVRGRLRQQRGIAYLGVLLLLAVVGLGMTQAARVWTTVQQRDREAQLLFVGDQFRAAIEGYYNAAGGSRYPASLEDLLEDRRTVQTQRHLRRVFADPMTGSANWGIVKSPDGGVMGVFSEAQGRPLKRQGFPDAYDGFTDSGAYSDWAFVYLPVTRPDGTGGPGAGGGPSASAH